MQKKYKVKNNKMILNFILMFCIILSTCLLSIGYAALVASDLNINLSVSANMQDGMFVSDIQYVSDIGADLGQSQIDYVGQVLHPNIYLSDGNSSITYKVTIYNNSDGSKVYTGIEFKDDYYSNDEIGYRLDGLIAQEKDGEGKIIVEGDHLHKGESIDFNITFYYKDPSKVTEHKLDAHLNFGFDYYFVEESDVDVEIGEDGSYEFAGVDENENKVDITNISNINFQIKNSNEEKTIIGLDVKIKYITSVGKKQSIKINLLDENNAVIDSVDAVFEGNQTNTEVTVSFSGLSIGHSEKVGITLDRTNNKDKKAQITGITIIPVYASSTGE